MWKCPPCDCIRCGDCEPDETIQEDYDPEDYEEEEYDEPGIYYPAKKYWDK